MPTWFSVRERKFAPSWPMTVLAVVLFAVFVSLGRWQWQRGEARQAMWADFEQRQAPSATLSGELEHLARFTRVEFSGRFETRHQFLLENRSHAGRAGYEVLTPFLLVDGRCVLVNRGWIPFTGHRDRLPDVTIPASEQQRISGRLDELPVAGLASGRAPPSPPGDAWPKLTSFPTPEELRDALGMKCARRILLLDADAGPGYVREWAPPGLAPDRHFAYAIQWWGFAVVLLVLYFGLNFRKVS